jgi:outer membrane protein OmpA-like peptidoglycan-associated protein
MRKRFIIILITSLCLISTDITHAQNQEFILDTICFNTEGNEYGFSKLGERFFVVSNSLPTSAGVQSRDEVTGLVYSDLFEVKGCELVPAELLSSEFNMLVSMNSSFHDGPIHSNLAGNLLFFTNNAFSPNNKLGIFYSIRLDDGSWTTPKASPMNSDEFNVTHPHFDEVSKTVYFASDKDGQYDIYSVNFDGKEWTNVTALSFINSNSIDCFPFYHDDKLYFTSNREGGEGGLDLYIWDKDSIKSMGIPFNSSYDDLALVWFGDTLSYFSSNRNSAGSHDDIFKVSIINTPIVVDALDKDSTETNDSFSLDQSIQFAFDRSFISENQKKYLDQIAMTLKTNTNFYLVVSGHTDNVGNEAYNLALSGRRAEEVKRYLINQGVEGYRLIVEVYGFSQPKSSNDTAEGRTVNRRVDFKLLSERE